MWKSVGEMAKLERVHVQTIRRKILNGKYEKVKRLENGYFKIWLDVEPEIKLYARVSTSNQTSSLNNQIEILKSRYPEGKIVTDVASGFNFERRGFISILERCFNGIPQIIVATNKDRITRTGFGLVKRIIELHGGEVVLLEEDAESENFDTTTLISFITSFVNSHYGKRGAEKRKLINKKDSNIS